MIKIFKDIKHQTDFDTNGFVVIPVLNFETINNLKEIYYTEVPQNQITNFASSAICSIEKNNIISDTLYNLTNPFFNNFLENYQMIGGSFLIKKNDNGSLGIHQDNNCVDNTTHAAAFAWTPLEDVNIKNGCMYVIKNSHLFFDNIVSFSYKNDNIYWKKIPEKYIVPIEMKAGEVLFFNPKLFHGSFKNQTNNTRIAINSLITDRNATITYYIKKDDDTALQYEISKYAYLNCYKYFSEGMLPEGAIFIKEISYRNKPIDHNILYKALTNKDYPKWKNLYFSIFKSLINEYN